MVKMKWMVMIMIMGMSLMMVNAFNFEDPIYGLEGGEATTSSTTIVNGSSNSSDLWDLLDTPADIGGSEFWYNFTTATYNLYNAHWLDDTVLSEATVDGYCSDNGYLTAETDPNLWTSSFNTTFDTLDDVGTGNASWNETRADSLYADKKWGYNMTDGYEADTDTTIGNCSSDGSCSLITYDSELWTSAFNTTFDTLDDIGTGNASWNETRGREIFYDSEGDLTTLLEDNYAGIEYDYNQTTATFNLYNDTWDQSWLEIFGYNHTLAVYNLWGQWFYNMTDGYEADTDTTIGNCSVDMSCSAIAYDSELTYTVDTSANINCSGSEAFLGNGSCIDVTTLEGDSDTNESTRVDALVSTDCGGTDKVTGVYNNGTVVCGNDDTSPPSAYETAFMSYDSGGTSCAVDSQYIGTGLASSDPFEVTKVLPANVNITGIACEIENIDAGELVNMSMYDVSGSVHIGAECMIDGNIANYCAASVSPHYIGTLGETLTVDFEEVSGGVSGHCGCSVLYIITD